LIGSAFGERVRRVRKKNFGHRLEGESNRLEEVSSSDWNRLEEVSSSDWNRLESKEILGWMEYQDLKDLRTPSRERDLGGLRDNRLE